VSAASTRKVAIAKVDSLNRAIVARKIDHTTARPLVEYELSRWREGRAITEGHDDVAENHIASAHAKHDLLETALACGEDRVSVSTAVDIAASERFPTGLDCLSSAACVQVCTSARANGASRARDCKRSQYEESIRCVVHVSSAAHIASRMPLQNRLETAQLEGSCGRHTALPCGPEAASAGRPRSGVWCSSRIQIGSDQLLAERCSEVKRMLAGLIGKLTADRLLVIAGFGSSCTRIFSPTHS